jgi:hypothetical protein
LHRQRWRGIGIPVVGWVAAEQLLKQAVGASTMPLSKALLISSSSPTASYTPRNTAGSPMFCWACSSLRLSSRSTFSASPIPSLREQLSR